MKKTRAEIIYEPEEADDHKLSVSHYQLYLLHSKADRILRSRVSVELEGFKISLMEWLLLGIVSEGPENGMSLSEIAKRLDVSQPQVTALMNSVSQHRLVKQRIQRHDRRSRHVLLSARGQRLLEQTEEAITERLTELLKRLSKTQREAYVETIRLISEQPTNDAADGKIEGT